ncbi:hypothetical protein KUTeg_012038 [Tegillarca granosa]|uniref:C2H2-type domain-containing protein n=1 Tax=Tegillarca granosa TaxID=220873 RepID=A0ABQ9EYE8_TEGGR|nr:hypothetical protein KUTeg_012038 [Tegillarca granosa]
MHFVSDIYEEQQYAFRLNLVFGVILQNRETGEYRYFAPYSNFEVLEDPVFISRRLDLRKLQRILHRNDIMTTILANRPDTKWIPVLLCNIIFRVTTTNYTVGGGQTLPDYIRDKRSIYSLVVDVNTRKLYEDNLCAFRCSALHKGYAINAIEKPAQEMFKQWCNFKKSNKKFHGVAYEEFPDFESFFKVNMEVYSLQEDDSCRSIYKSRCRFDSTMYVNLYENHLSYIKSFPQFANKFQCSICERHFDQFHNLRQHQKVCTNKTKYIHPGKFYKMPATLFEKLEEFGITVPLEERNFPWFICYDFESILENVELQQTTNLQWTRKHVPISVSICSNVPEHTEPMCIIDSNQNQLVKSMVEKMVDIAVNVKKLAIDKWSWVDKAITDKIHKYKCVEQESDSDEDEEIE